MASHDEVTPLRVKVGDEVVAVRQGARLLLQQQGLGVKDVDVADACATADGDDAVFRPCHVAAVIGNVMWLQSHQYLQWSVRTARRAKDLSMSDQP